MTRWWWPTNASQGVDAWWIMPSAINGGASWAPWTNALSRFTSWWKMLCSSTFMRISFPSVGNAEVDWVDENYKLIPGAQRSEQMSRTCLLHATETP